MFKNDLIFRLILITGIILLMPFAFYFRLKSKTGEKLDRLKEGIFILISLRITGLAGMTGLILYLINPSLMQWSHISLTVWLRLSGAVLGIFAGLLLIWTLRTLGKNLTDTVVTRKDHSLIINGPYRYVRHPFYCAGTLAIFSNSMVAANFFLFLCCISFFILIAVRTPIEERFLEERFGEEYKNYKKSTGLFFPKLKKGIFNRKR